MDSTSIFTTLDQDLDEQFEDVGTLSEIQNRARGALMLFYNATGHPDTWRDEAFIRAGLNEFYAIGEVVVREHRVSGDSVTPKAIEESQNPLLHLMLLLRHITVHTQTCIITRHEATVT